MTATAVRKRKTDQLPFDDTGILLDDPDGPMFLADGGGRYRLDYCGALPPGTWVHVAGTVDYSFASVTRQQAGLISRNVIEPMSSNFEGSGELVQGRETLLLQTPDGKQYILNDTRDFNVGERVKVRGTLIPLRLTFFEDGNACILNDTIERAA